MTYDSSKNDNNSRKFLLNLLEYIKDNDTGPNA